MKIRKFEGKNKNVKKYVFTKDDSVFESVIYKYPTYKERTVICISVQSGCPVGCVFCGTGKRFIRNLSSEEIKNQVYEVLKQENIIDIALKDKINKFQIMFMSMGEPMLNWLNVRNAIIELNRDFRNAQLLISTMGIKDYATFFDIVKNAKKIDKIGLQFSLHNSIDKERDLLIPYKNKFSIRNLRDMGLLFCQETGKKVYLNYCVSNTNSAEEHTTKILDIFPPNYFCLTFSVICNPDKTKKVDITDYDALYKMQDLFLKNGYDVKIFDPAGKDDIGGGCGQLWYVQEWLKNYKYPTKNPSKIN